MKRIVLAALVLTIRVHAQPISGAWVGTQHAHELNLRLIQDHDNNGFSIDISALTGLSETQIVAAEETPVAFQLRRPAGTFDFKGSFSGSRGTGSFTFSRNEAFTQDLRSFGYDSVRDDVMMLFAITNLSTDWIRELRSMGYTATLSQLEDVAIFRITPAYIRDLAAAGLEKLSIAKLEDLRIGRVDAALIRDYHTLGYDNISADRLSELGIHRVTPDYIRTMASLGYGHLSLEQLLEIKIHRVTPEYIEQLRQAGYENVPLEKLLQLRMSGLDKMILKKQ